MSLAADARDWMTALSLVAPTLVMIVNTWQTYRTRRDMARLEVNTNSKMDKLLKASVGEASAVGEKIGREAEIARQKTEKAKL